MAKNILWRNEPPEASAEDWAAVYERVIEMVPLDDEGDNPERDGLLRFVLDDTLGRCRLEAENRKPGILHRRLQVQLEKNAAQISEITD